MRQHPLSGRTRASVEAEAAIHADLDEFARALEEARQTNIGFPGATDFDYAALAPFFASHLLNNVGDPFSDGTGTNHTKAMEREVVAFVADLMRAPAGDRWGYVTTGASEGTLYALLLARALYPNGMTFVSDAAHYSVEKALDMLAMRSITVRADENGEVDYNDLAGQVDRHRESPAIVVANIGTTMTEAVDDVRRINQILDAAAIRRRFVHADAALSGIPLALLPIDERPGFDFADGADSVIVSGHKFIGSPIPSGVVVVRASHRARLAQSIAYTGSPDTTITGSRSGHAPMLWWYAIRRHGIEGFRRRADQAREIAAYAHRQLIRIGWDARRNPNAFTVVLRTPPPPVTARWVLASSNGWSHIVCMPGVTRDQIDAFVADLHATTLGASSIVDSGHAVVRRLRPNPN
jgi:histidine decarboxylase